MCYHSTRRYHRVCTDKCYLIKFVLSPSLSQLLLQFFETCRQISIHKTGIILIYLVIKSAVDNLDDKSTMSRRRLRVCVAEPTPIKVFDRSGLCFVCEKNLKVSVHPVFLDFGNVLSKVWDRKNKQGRIGSEKCGNRCWTTRSRKLHVW